MNLPLLKYRNMINNIRDWRFEQLALTTTIFSMLLTIIAIMNISSYFGKFMAEHNTMVIFSLVVLVLFFQMAIFGIIRHHLSNNNNNNALILYILLLSSITSSIKVSLISYIAGFITFILCSITHTWWLPNVYCFGFTVISLINMSNIS
jgi:uncharacterized membrane protein